MKTIYKYLLLLLSAVAAGGAITSCSDDDEGGTPYVSYVRITRASSSDSLLVAAGQGQMVAIMGRNLQNVQQIWFNDQKAVLNPTFITGSSVITRVPSQIPLVLSNKMKLIFANGDSLFHDFTTDISEPRQDRMKNEYVAEGKEAVVYGDFFYEPISVKFGDIEAEIVSVKDQEIHFIVPEGAAPGPVTMTSNFGVSESIFWFHDPRSIIASFDGTFAGMWKGSDFVVAADPDIPNINGKFARVNKNLGAWPFLEMYGGPKESDVKLETKNIPEAALIAPDAFNLKFEVNTLASLTGANLRIYIGNAAGGQFDAERQSRYYVWQANVNTEGEWQTITIPWVDVFNAARHPDTGEPFSYDPEGYGMFLYFHGPNALEHNLALDNFRVVPNIQ